MDSVDRDVFDKDVDLCDVDREIPVQIMDETETFPAQALYLYWCRVFLLIRSLKSHRHLK